MTRDARRPLEGLRVLEIAGIGPGPFCGMLLADLGADVVVADRPVGGHEKLDLGPADVVNRGKRSIVVDLKTRGGVETVLRLVEQSDALIEGMRPGVMERLGLGPGECLARNPRLAYGRITGWGQQGPLSHAAGHDLNYIALSGALWYAGQPGEPPLTPPSVVGDVGGGALYLALGLLAAVMSARETGRGQVIDAAIVDGSAHMLNLLLGLKGAGRFSNERGKSMLDGPHWYATYRCADDRFISIGAVEVKFYRLLCEKLGLAQDPAFADGHDIDRWPQLRGRFAELFVRRTQAEWCALLEGTDVCFAPVLSVDEAAEHPHLAARATYLTDFGVLQAGVAPRFSGSPDLRPGRIPRSGGDEAEIRRDWLGER